MSSSSMADFLEFETRYLKSDITDDAFYITIRNSLYRLKNSERLYGRKDYAIGGGFRLNQLIKVMNSLVNLMWLPVAVLFSEYQTAYFVSGTFRSYEGGKDAFADYDRENRTGKAIVFSFAQISGKDTFNLSAAWAVCNLVALISYIFPLSGFPKTDTF